MAEIPAFVIEYFLLGRTRRDAIERYTQNGGIVSDVWLAFAADRTRPQRVLVAPSQGTSAVVLGYSLHCAISGYRKGSGLLDRLKPTVSPLENFVAVTLYFDELLRIILPFTAWWHRKNLGALRPSATRITPGPQLETKLKRRILVKLGGIEGEIEPPSSRDPVGDSRVVEAASMAALIGVFQVADEHPEYMNELQGLDPHRPLDAKKFAKWIDSHAEEIAQASVTELSRPQNDILDPVQAQRGFEPGEPPELIQKVFLDRKASLADTEANCTIKADAAIRVFDVSCRSITWAIIDSGIATTHPAFLDHDARDRRGVRINPPPTRIRATLDFTRIEMIRNFDLIAFPEDSTGRKETIDKIVTELETLPGRSASGQPLDPGFRSEATRYIESIARQLDQQIPPDWNLIERLIRLGDKDDGAQLVSDHGTHVAGIMAADWRSETTGPDGKGGEVLLEGVCPDMSLYDLRVIHPESGQSTEFAVLAALEYVQFVNARAASNGPLIHGVNVSLSIPHDVRNYGCGATPVCVACDRLVSAGVVVVAAAGNRGWNEMEMGFGNFVFCSITDPGNARDVITVGSTHRLKPHMYGVSYFSSRGPTGDGRAKPDLVAPGEQIRGPIRGDADDELDGTSMAAPFVSGAAAMLIARNRELIGDPERIKKILCDTATDLGREKYFQGHGLVDVLRALQSV